MHWSDPGTWGGSVPGPTDVATIAGPVLLDTDAHVAGVNILPGGELRFGGRGSRTLESSGNVEVEGRLIMRSPSTYTQYTLRFVDVDEALFAGGGMNPLPSDVGLWVIGAGVLEAVGASRSAWTRLGEGAEAGVSHLWCLDTTNWEVGDTVVVAPSAVPSSSPSDTSWFEGVEERSITGFGWGYVFLDSPLTYDHPIVDGRFAPEVANLTRNVAIEGTPQGRSHIFIRSTQPSAISHVDIRHMGPRKDGEKIVGRWALHWHHCDTSQAGVVIDGVVVQGAGSHAFVPHTTHGITLRDCIAYDGQAHAFWWDDNRDAEVNHSNDSNDVVWEDCLALATKPDPSNPNAAGFYLSPGVRNTIRGCVAAGSLANGVSWPAECCGGDWIVDGVVAHNNGEAGWITYTNAPVQPMVEGVTSYHNTIGLDHGAYKNGFTYAGFDLFANLVTGIALKARGTQNLLIFRDGAIDQAGLADYGIVNDRHSRDSIYYTRIERVSFAGCNVAGLGIIRPENEPELIELMDCVFLGNELWMASGVNPDSVVRFRGAGVGNLDARPVQTAGATFRPEWNAWVTPA